MSYQRSLFALGVCCASIFLNPLVYSQEEGQTIDARPVGIKSAPKGVITPAVAPSIKNDSEVFLTGDFIYWQAQQDGLDFAISGGYGFTALDPDTGKLRTVGPTSSSVKQVPRPWEPGFKLGFGMNLQHDGWDLFAQWTWLNPILGNKKSVKRDTSNESNILSNIPARTGTVFKTAGNNYKITGAWGLHYNVIDLELGRNFFLSRYMTYRPHFGLKTAWINQTFQTHFYPTTDLNQSSDFFQLWKDDTNYAGGVFKQNQKLKSWGLGIRAGIDPVWHFAKNWGVYGNLALSAMYQYYSASGTLNGYNTAFVNASDGTTAPYKAYPISSTMEVMNAHRSNHTVTPVLELGLGLEYMAWFYDESYMLELKAGWEEQVWFNTNRFMDAMSTGNLTLQGFTFKAGFHF